MCDSVGMRTWIVRFVALYAFNVIVLLLIGALFPSVRVGFAALWASILLTAATLWIKPAARRLIDRWTQGVRSTATATLQKVLEYATAFVVALAMWFIVVALSSVTARGLWGYVLPALALLVAWVIYDLVDDRFEKTTADLIDRGTARGTPAPTPTSGSAPTGSTSPAPPRTPASDSGRRELNDGLTDEQRRMFDELG